MIYWITVALIVAEAAIRIATSEEKLEACYE